MVLVFTDRFRPFSSLPGTIVVRDLRLTVNRCEARLAVGYVSPL
jgi:hypothetical protein